MSPIGEGPVRVGVLGCGNVSSKYLRTVAHRPEISLLACADLDPARARAIAGEYGVGQACTMEELITHPEVDLVLNLTPPSAHAALSVRCLEAGKHVYSEKPLATTLEDARLILTTSRLKGLQVGTAPDTFLGVGATTVARLIREGAIGTPVSVNAAMMNPGPERFHPEPEFLYRDGAGPLFDIGPYYVTLLTELLGPVAKVGALGRATQAERVIGRGPRSGEVFRAETETHINSILEFANGVLGTLVTSFDVQATRAPHVEIHGTTGTIATAQANSWGGPVWLQTSAGSEFVQMLPEQSDMDGYMGMGLVEMAVALTQSRVPAASGARAAHVLEVLVKISESVRQGGAFLPISSNLSDFPLAS